MHSTPLLDARTARSRLCSCHPTPVITKEKNYSSHALHILGQRPSSLFCPAPMLRNLTALKVLLKDSTMSAPCLLSSQPFRRTSSVCLRPPAPGANEISPHRCSGSPPSGFS
ncbi:hypothetical protein H1C71_027448 [Ictidomys tridecemlineatus]|nr:hypothetical protein H1C71_027448 [Ictidomys tridecemlineatus]KAG3257704.1 hypothetical protein H1C71_027448 [Ictidomys tridecemlineatus]KAG3257705.1 hypothetical protein H1C71_027448 [Ictidomys tridecemlineatus]KAG3257706.1 hypothetical protein H1C71_027448 [Ictidomys tridecemlineatus]